MSKNSVNYQRGECRSRMHSVVLLFFLLLKMYTGLTHRGRALQILQLVGVIFAGYVACCAKDQDQHMAIGEHRRDMSPRSINRSGKGKTGINAEQADCLLITMSY